jgi:hypothetical protein
MEAPKSGSDSYWPYHFLASCKGHIGRRLSGTLIAVSLLDRAPFGKKTRLAERCERFPAPRSAGCGPA